MMTTSEQTLIRILVGRAEKDLGDIVQYFAEENYGEGKTLKQWIENALNGSFRTSLLRIAGLSDNLNDEAIEDEVALEDYESVTADSDYVNAEGPGYKQAAASMFANAQSHSNKLSNPKQLEIKRHATAPPPSSPQAKDRTPPPLDPTMKKNLSRSWSLRPLRLRQNI